MRQLVSAEPLESWARKFSSEPLHFVSYRTWDGTRSAFEKVEALRKQEKNVFWDGWSLPRRLAERRELVANDRLDSYLMTQLEASAWIWSMEHKE
jgi:hypothetical protein